MAGLTTSVFSSADGLQDVASSMVVYILSMFSEFLTGLI